VPQAELAGSPYDGVQLPSTQVEPPSVQEGKPQTSLATLPPGTPTVDAYTSTASQPTGNAATSYPSTPYPSTPYPKTSYPSTAPPSGTASFNAGSGAVPQSALSGGPPSKSPRNDQATPFGSNPVANPGLQTENVPAAGSYSLNPPSTNRGATPLAGVGGNPLAANNVAGPRYNSNVGTATPPSSTNYPTTASPRQNPVGPRYATLPSGGGGPRYDARPAPSVASPVPSTPGAPSPPSYAVVGTTATTDIAKPNPQAKEISRYPQAPVQGTAAGFPATESRNVPSTPFQPGSTSRYVPKAPDAPSPVSTPGKNYRFETPYNPPANTRP